MPSSSKASAQSRPVRIDLPRRGLINAPTLARILGKLIPALLAGRSIEIIGANAARTNADGSATFEVRPGSETDHPWKLSASGTGGSTKITVLPASVNSTGMPTIGGDPLDDDPPPELTGYGKVYGITKWDCSLTDDDSFVYAATLRKEEISVGVASSIPADSGAGTTLQTKHFHIGTVSDAGAVTAQVLKSSLSLEACDDRTGNGEIEISFKLAE